ncbi:10581_t:CDS:2, partial [Racocetra persica]
SRCDANKARFSATTTALTKNDPSISTTLCDIYNVHKKVYLENLQGKIPIQTLVKELEDGQFKYNYKCDNLPCAHTIQERLAKNQILDLDNIYQHWHIEHSQLLLPNRLKTGKHSLQQLLQEFSHEYASWSAPQQATT